jgi:hypothetical protein
MNRVFCHFTSCVRLCTLGFSGGLSGVLTVFMLALSWGAAAAAETDNRSGNLIIDFNSSGFGWHSRTVATLPPVAGTPGEYGPIGNHPEFPHYSNNSGHIPTERIGNDLHPLLLPWAATIIREANEAIHAGGPRFGAAPRCWPPGVPGILNFTAQPALFLQNPDNVTIIYERGQIARHVYLNEKHPDAIEPSWMGHSVGHYEGDMLVVDTIALDPRAFTDEFGTPHTDRLHVVEHYRIVQGSPSLITVEHIPVDTYFVDPANEVLQVIAWIEDPGTFHAPYAVMQVYERATDYFKEIICQENNDDRFDQGLVPVPNDSTPDF